MIGIRADANETIASGHIMRCIAIAQQIESLGEEVIFITADHFPDRILDDKRFKHICIDTDWKNKDSELPVLKKLLKDYDIRILLIDSYEITEKYLYELHQSAKLVYIDDIYKFAYPVDLLINYTRNVKEEIYRSLYSKVSYMTPEWLLGTKYIPLRREFQNQETPVKERVTDILITTGASDTLNVVYNILEKIIGLQKWNDIRFHVIIGEFFSNVDKLYSLAKSNGNFVLYKSVNNMAEIMKQCDIAISAGGVTLSELCACGIPTICFASASNQLDSVQGFVEDDIMLSPGDIRQDITQGIEDIIKYMTLFIDNYNLRTRCSKKAKEAIDGNGAYRIAKHILT